MRASVITILVFLSWISVSNGQFKRSDTLFMIDDRPYSSVKFLKKYENNAPIPLNEALNKYVDLQLKVLEAKFLKLDTLPEFKKKFKNYQKQVIATFMNPARITEEKIKEAFQRMKYFIDVRHILFKIKKNASYADTLQTYNKALKVREQILKGENFSDMAKMYSADLSVHKNKGHLGYVTVFQLPYPFESVAYKLKVNEISIPVRTKYGYHLIQILDKIPNPGNIKIAHIMVAVPDKSTSEQKMEYRQRVEYIYKLLKKNGDFAEIARKYSDDVKSANKGGELPWFGAYKIIPEFEKAAFALKSNGDISKPIKTPYGWHIIKRLDIKPIGSYQQNRNELVKLIKKDGRCNIPKEKIIDYLKTKYNFRENREQLSNFYSILNYAYADLSKPIFHISDSSYSQESFAKYLEKQPSKNINEKFQEYINRIYDSFVNSSILARHKKELEQNNSTVNGLLEEYYVELLISLINNKMIIEPSNKDTEELGLTNFFFSKYKEYQIKFGENVRISDGNKDIRNSVISDFQKHLEEKWMQKLHQKYQIKIFNETLKKIEQDYE